MKRFEKIDQSGRSMIEMLGVLAIIGVLSIGGIAGYTKAMSKYKITKATDNLTMLLADIRTLYADKQAFVGLSNESVLEYELAPSGMVGPDEDTLVNAFGGSVFVTPVKYNGITAAGFVVVYNGMDKASCMNLATSDWGNGVFGITVNGTNIEAAPADTIVPEIAPADLPISLNKADQECSSDSPTNSIIWFFT